MTDKQQTTDAFDALLDEAHREMDAARECGPDRKSAIRHFVAAKVRIEAAEKILEVDRGTQA